MKLQSKKLTVLTPLCSMALALVLGIGGCASTRNSSAGSWDWAPPPRLDAGHAGSSGAVIVSPVQADTQYFAYAQGEAPEFYRRDESLNIRSNDPTAGFLGFPEQERPSLENYRTFYSGRTAERYAYPIVREEYHSYRRTTRNSYRPTRKPSNPKNNKRRPH